MPEGQKKLLNSQKSISLISNFNHNKIFQNKIFSGENYKKLGNCIFNGEKRFYLPGITQRFHSLETNLDFIFLKEAFFKRI